MIDQLPRSATYVNPERSGVGRHSYVPRLSTPSHDNITYQRDESGETISQNGPPRIKLQVLESHRHLAPVVSQVASFVAGAPSAAAVGRSTISAVVTLLSTYGAKFAPLRCSAPP